VIVALALRALDFWVGCRQLLRNACVTISCSRGELMANPKGLISLVSDLRVERTNLAKQLRNFDKALAVLDRLKSSRKRRTLSAAARKKISLAQKARWAKRTSSGLATTVRPKRKLSAAARRKIAAAQRARWAKVRAGANKKAA
jgi:hypothetical protein